MPRTGSVQSTLCPVTPTMQEIVPASKGRGRIVFSTEATLASVSDKKGDTLLQGFLFSNVCPVIIDRREYGDMVDHAWYGGTGTNNTHINVIMVMEEQPSPPQSLSGRPSPGQTLRT